MRTDSRCADGKGACASFAYLLKGHAPCAGSVPLRVGQLPKSEVPERGRQDKLTERVIWQADAMTSLFSEDIFLLVLRDLDVRALALSGSVCKCWQELAGGLVEEPHWVTGMSRKNSVDEAVAEVFSYCSRRAFRPNVAILFLTDDMLRPPQGGEDAELEAGAITRIVSRELAKLPPELCLVGCTGVGIVGLDIASQTAQELEPADVRTFTPQELAAMNVEAPTTAEVEGRESRMVQRSGVSLALARVAAATPHGFLIKTKEDADSAMNQLTTLYGDAAGRSVRALVLADVHSHRQSQRLQTLIQQLDCTWPASEVTGGLASSFQNGLSRVLFRGNGRADEEVVLCKGATALLTLASKNHVEAGAEVLPLTHATVARNYAPVGPVLRVLEADKLLITKVAVVEAGAPPEGGEGVLPGQKLIETVESMQEMGMSPGGIMCGISACANANASQLPLFDIAGIPKGGIQLDCDCNMDAVPVGSILRFMSANMSGHMEKDVIDTMHWTGAYLQTKPGFGNRLVDGGRAEAKTRVRGSLMFACCGRGAAFYEKANVDSLAFMDAFPSAQGVCGFFCNGEIGPTHLGSSSTQMHGFTSVYTLFEGV